MRCDVTDIGPPSAPCLCMNTLEIRTSRADGMGLTVGIKAWYETRALHRRHRAPWCRVETTPAVENPRTEHA